MSPAGLLALPTELINLILSSSHSPHDLFAIIRCSKLLYWSFNASWVSILAEVIQNAFGEATLYDALAACEASQICRTWASDPTGPLYKHQERFIAEYASHRSTRNIILREPTLLFSLSKLWWTTNNFISLFQTNAFRYMVDQIPLLHSDHTRPITALEETRL